MPADLIAQARDALPPDLYQQAAYVIVRPLWSLFGRVFRVYTADGRLAFFVRRPLFRIRDRLILFADEDETIPVLEIRNRSLLSLNMCHDVLDALTGLRLGSVRTRGLSWMWRDTWDVLDPDDRVCGTMQEDTLSLVRRFLRFWPGRHHVEIGGSSWRCSSNGSGYFAKYFRYNCCRPRKTWMHDSSLPVLWWR